MICDFVFLKNAELNDLDRRNIARLAQSDLKFSDLVTSWTEGPKQRISFVTLPVPPGEEPTIVISLERLGQAMAMAMKRRSELVSGWGNYQPIKEEVIRYADEDRCGADPLWLERRNKRMNIRWSARHECILMPFRNMANLVLSYALSSRGMVHIEKILHEDSCCRIRPYYRISCIFLTAEPLGGWVESVYVEDSPSVRTGIPQQTL
ncbi:MAG: hypothetical protein PHC51_14250 [bacterium]|nr:hypothetical protein [bacterium]